MWSKTSQRWIAELQRYRNIDDQKDGTFWMDLNTYVDNFYSTTICHW
ncbi:MAG: C2 family cysteine protease [bacterium]